MAYSANIVNIRGQEYKYDDCWVDVWDNEKTKTVVIVDCENRAVQFSHASAIAAARAILKHFNVGME